MKTETTYFKNNLKKSKYTCCGEKSNEILIGDDRCVDCIEEEIFIEETMKPKHATQRSLFGIYS